MSPAFILALAIMLEAEGEPMSGKMAVASVIWNTAGKHKTADSLARSVMKRRRFDGIYRWCCQECAMKDMQNKTDNPISRKAWMDCRGIALAMVTGNFAPTTAATHFYNPKKCSPKWAKKMIETEVIGNHRFMKENKS